MQPLGSLSIRRKSWFNARFALFLLVFSLIVGIAPLQVRAIQPAATLAAGPVSGIVFLDFNGDGEQNTVATREKPAVDLGRAGIVVTAYAPSTTAGSIGTVVGTATTDSNGVYAITLDPSVQSGDILRIEFTSIPTTLRPGPSTASGATTVQFVTANNAGVDGVELSLVDPSLYCENNPQLIVACYTGGDPVPVGNAATRDVLVSIPFNSGAPLPADQTVSPPIVPSDGRLVKNGGTIPLTQIAVGRQVGSIWGITYQRATKQLFSAAFTKRHVGYASGGPGAIYKTDLSVSPPTTALFVDVATTLGIDVLGSFTGLNSRGLSPDPSLPSTDPDAADGVGKTSLGGLTITGDDTLWFVSLNTRTLHSLPIASPTLANMNTYSIPTTDCANSNDARPWAAAAYRDEVYVGLVCSAQSSQDRNELKAVIYKLSPPAATLTKVFEFPLTYTKGFASGARDPREPQWNPWRGTIVPVPFTNVVVYPQPILSDLDFDIDGSMIISLADRTGHQTGNANLSEDGALSGLNGVVGGDMLRACLVSGVYQLENGGLCNGTGAGLSTTTNAQGPGGGEYYSGEFFRPHQETSLGSAAQYPNGLLVAANMDPFDLNSSGMNFFDNATGQDVRRAEMIKATASVDSFGKSGGLGEVDMICQAAPIEIGNRVWYDVDKDGIQDPAEAPVPGVTVRLYDDQNNLIDTAITNANGEYVFSSDTSRSNTEPWRKFTAGLKPNNRYEVRLDNPADYALNGPLFEYILTNPETNSGDNTLIRDSNGRDTTDPTGSPAGTWPVAVVLPTDIPKPGSNNHTFDFGFFQNPTAIQLTSFTTSYDPNGVLVSWRTAAELNTAGFQLLRNTSGDRASAVLITPSLIPAQGSPSRGASYQWLDRTAAPGVRYTYWLVERELDGTTAYYGPVLQPQSVNWRFYLPFVR